MAKWNGTNEMGKNVASGVYLYTLMVDDLKLSSKMMMVK